MKTQRTISRHGLTIKIDKRSAKVIDHESTKKPNWITATAAAEALGIKSRNYFHVHRCQNGITDNQWLKTEKRISYVDVNYFLSKSAAIEKLYKEAEDLYFELIEIYTETEMANIMAGNTQRGLHSWQQYINQDICTGRRMSGLSNVVSLRAIEFIEVMS